MKKEERRYRFVQKMLETVTGASILSMEQTNGFRRDWRKAFIPNDVRSKDIPLHGCSNCVGRRNSFDWHYYSFNHFPAEKDPVGRIRDSAHPQERVVVWIELCKMPAIELRAGELADFLQSNQPPTEELYIANRKLSWTAVFTHEDDFGPYFVVKATKK
jgi:hypothetical protein